MTSTEQAWVLLALLAGFAVKIPVFPLHTWQLAELGDGKDGTQVAINAFDAAMTTEETQQQTVLPFSSEKIITEAFSTLWSDVSNAIKDGKVRVEAAWDTLPEGTRGTKLILVGSAIAGLLLGLLIAIFMPFTASAMITSTGGSWLLLITIRNVIAMERTQNPFTTMSTTAFAISIAAVSLAGFALQMTVFKHPPDAKAKKK